ncbi:MAG: hypothetical protein IKK40_01230 [Bacteroidales bacterium]|nr:hypothetical protein [Bacteroidales bacterium]
MERKPVSKWRSTSRNWWQTWKVSSVVMKKKFSITSTTFWKMHGENNARMCRRWWRETSRQKKTTHLFMV